ncbi:C-Jun-amino-terminal kinase-interacting protein 4 isoform X3 [Kryptolebias marmoratus]|uniref:C-Jun-amino-terminal kinase-interacting protein 4 isoform X3 n=1 Tax=Kryptolebias marmoratus TaxID=37003 RepID=UPI0018ACBA9D|nr:C-Jun-amino-terminal kinase-interacting protein 4 isoform X3 [Kryptolebias marmoratus]
MELDDAVLYQDDSSDSSVMSERVSGLASSIYREFERLIEKYDEDVVKELMPLVVGLLENLDSVSAANKEHEVELELLREDNEQLVTQYEREKSLRKHVEERYIALEDSQDGEKKDLQSRLVMLESHARQLELKTKNYADQISRFEEREADLKKEYNALHQRHTEMIHSYMEHLERTKHQHSAPPAESSDTGTSAKRRKERPISMGILQLPGIDGVTPELQREPSDPPSEPWRFNNVSHPLSNTSLKFEELFSTIREEGRRSQEDFPDQGVEESQDEMAFANRGSAKPSTPTNQGNISKTGMAASSSDGRSKANASMSSQGDSSKSNTTTSTHGGNSQPGTPLPPRDVASLGQGVASSTPLSAAPSDVAVESVDTPLQEQDTSGGLGKNLDMKNGNAEGGKDVGAVQEEQQSSQSAGTALKTEDGAENVEKSEVQAIIESTPELDMDFDGCRGTSTPTKGGIENLAFNRNTDSLFEELSSAGNDLVGDVDEGADLLGMGREVEHLIHENTQLLETKNALNVVKNDLIAQVDELSCEKEVLRGELDAVTQAKTKLEEKNKELEEELKKVKAELEETKHKIKNDNEDDSDVPTAQRKRFTRVEMARVLMERNQYKERLMELQEAVRWTEMIRASKENSSLPEKKKSSLWQLSRLFSSSGGAGKKPPAEAPVNVKYNAPTSQIQPSVKKKSSTLQQLPSDKSKAFDFLNEEAPAESVTSRREQKRAQYKQVKAHVQKEDDRVQAYGWSLPKKYKVNGAQAEGKMKNLPVPVFLRPLDEKDPSMKLWCAAGVNLSGGKTRDGGSIVGASVFYSDSSGQESPKKKTGSQSSLDKLDQELKEQQKELQHQDEFSSLVWISTSTQSTSKVVVIDANQPGNILESFIVCNSHVFCITSVPGARETDYPAGEEVSLKSDLGPEGDGSLSAATSSSGGGDSVLGGITVVGCEAEGATAVPQTGDRPDPRPAEEATEATETSAGPVDHSEALRGVYTEHVFTDPLGAQQAREAPANYSQRESDLLKDGVSSNPSTEEPDPMIEEAQKMSSVLPTMWLGAQNGCVYVHSSVAHWKKCLHSVKLKKPVVGIVHVKGRILVSLSDSTLAIFHRGVDGQWDLTNYHLLDLGKQHHSIRCMTIVHDKVWCGYRNKIYVVHPRAMKMETSFDAHPRKDSQVRQLAWHGDGIWVSIKLDSTLRLFHARTYQHLQDIDIEPYVSKMLGTGKLGFSFVRITALMVSCNRLWIGTGNGVIISIPLTEATNNVAKAAGNHPGGVVRVYADDSGDKVTAGTFVPYCSMAHAQLSFHGHRNAVQFFAAVPGHSDLSAFCGGETAGEKSSDSSTQEGSKTMLVMSGGEGYIDFRMGDEDGEAEEAEGAPMKLHPFLAKAERSHLIVWHVSANEDRAQ